MTRHLVIGVVFIMLGLQGLAQISPERSAIRAMEKKRWQKAETQLRKSIAKDSINALARYYLSVYFFTRDNPFSSLDSAYSYCLQSLSDLTFSDAKQRDRMKRFSLDSGSIVSLRKQIDSAAFEHARLENTEQALIRFLQKYTWASQRDEALLLRDEIAYLDALKTNTYQGFYNFLHKYPHAARATEARDKYNKLLYEAETKDKRLQSFEKFLRDHPETPFREEVERNILELFTITGEVERYLSFLNVYPRSSQAKKATNILYHLLTEKEDAEWPRLFDSDSLQNIRRLRQGYLVPVLHDDKFGFIDNGGLEIIPPVAETLSEEYKCGNITEDVIVLPDRILALDKTVIYSGTVEEVDDLGAGFLKLKTGDCYQVVHKSSFPVDSCVEDAKVIGARLISIKKNDSWSLHALTGRKILTGSWQDIAMHNNVLALKKDDRWSLIKLSHLSEAMHNDRKFKGVYDEIRLLENGFIWVKTGEKQAALNQSLEEVVPVSDHDITPAFFGFIGKSSEGYTLYSRLQKPVSYFENIELSEPWVKVKRNGSMFLFDADSADVVSRAYDSIRFEGPFVVAMYADSAHIYFAGKKRHTVIQPFEARFVPGLDTTSFLSVSTYETTSTRRGKKTTELKTVYSRNGRKLFTAEYDAIQCAGEGLFIVHKKEKKGLIDFSGRPVLPVEYDAIGSVANNVVSLLKSMKFGLYNTMKRKLIRPQYDKNLVPFNDRLVAVYDDGLYGLVDWDNSEKSEAIFEDITYWNDSMAMVKKDQRWALMNINTGKVSMADIREVKLIRDTPDEKIAIIRQRDRYGVISNRRGVVIPVTFSDIINIGSHDEPLYFTEKHVSEADIFVVIYYDKNGKFLRREIYEEGEDYERIYCHD